MGAQGQFAIDLHCDNCGQDGTAAWESEVWHGYERIVLVRLSEGFYERVTRKAPHRTEIVCGSCGYVRLGNSMSPEDRCAPHYAAPVTP